MRPIYVSFEELESELRILGLESDGMIVKALKQAQKSIGRKKRKEGTPYLEGHIYPVTLSILSCPELDGRITPELVAGALLHDVLEDDETVGHEEFK